MQKEPLRSTVEIRMKGGSAALAALLKQQSLQVAEHSSLIDVLPDSATVSEVQTSSEEVSPKEVDADGFETNKNVEGTAKVAETGPLEASPAEPGESRETATLTEEVVNVNDASQSVTVEENVVTTAAEAAEDVNVAPIQQPVNNTSAPSAATNKYITPKVTPFNGSNKCFVCTKTVYKMEEIIAIGHCWHDKCFTCGGTNSDGCNRVLKRDSKSVTVKPASNRQF